MMRSVVLSIVAAFATSGLSPLALAQDQNFGGLTGRRETSRASDDSIEVWLEAFESYTIPFDPTWHDCASPATVQQGFASYFPRASAELEQKAAAAKERAARSKSTEDGARKLKQTSDELGRRKKGLIDDCVQLREKPMPITVVRGWDGIEQAEVVISFGRGQKALADRLQPSKVLRGSIALAAPGEDLQARRATLREIQSISKTPSEFARAADARQEILELGFGEIDPSALPNPVVIPAIKDPTPGSGVFTLSVDLRDNEVGLDARFPWYAEFRLFELEKDGSRKREVKFDGPDAVVAINGGRQGSVERANRSQLQPRQIYQATGRIEVRAPQPWGYEAEIVRWFGVAPKSRHKQPPSNAAGGSAGTSGQSTPSSGPASTPQPK